MNDLFVEIERYFTGYKTLFGDKLYLSRQLTDNRMQDDSVVPAENIAETAANKELESFYNEIHTCRRCALGSLRTNFVFGMGSPNADLMFVGEAPGKDEDLQGKPFVGRAGQLLTLMLKAINLTRDEVYIANVLKCRPPNNRDPFPEEVEKCEPYLLRQIDLIGPKLIVTLGRYAAASLLRTKLSLGALRKELHAYNNVPLVVTYHPAALLRNPLLKKDAWEDLKKIAAYLKRV
jgi:uracil-DNA glycosylase family 4